MSPLRPNREVRRPALSPKERSLRGYIAAKTRESLGGYSADTGKRGQAGLLAKFEQQVDPNGELTPEERTRRAEAARAAHMALLSFKSARARSERRNGARAH
jgi:hypothetical protein